MINNRWPWDVPSRSLSVPEYCVEEVERQGHDTARLDGVERVGWMLEAWCYALRETERARNKLAMFDIERLGSLVEPVKNRGGFRRCDVTVGGKRMPAWFHVETRLKALLREQGNLDPLAFYRAFLEVHPFADGNGRTGKILLNWKNGTLLENPIFPPADFWGAPIRNP